MQASIKAERQARFAAMQSVAGSTFLAALVCAFASHYFFNPALWFAVGCLVAGTLVFMAWRSALKEQGSRPVVFAGLGLTVALASLAPVLGDNLAVIMATGLSHIAVTLFGLISLSKWRQDL